jgi:DNA end-binding protein Ku
MLPATSEAEKVRFHTLNRATGNRVHARYVDAETGKPVDDKDQVKGYEREDGEYVMLEDEELQAVALESTRTIDIDCFVPAGSIGWIWYDTPHYLIPDDKVGEEAFSVIREAMVKSDMRAISRVVLNHRERAVLLEPRDKGMVLWTLRYGDEVRDETEYFKGIKGKPDPKKKKLLAQLIETHIRDWTPSLAADPVQQETAAGSSASPPVCVVIARLVRSCRPTFTITTGLPSAAARSSAAAKRSGSRIASINPPTMAVCGSSRRYSRNAAALTAASLPEETIWLKPKRRVSVSRPTQSPPLCERIATLPASSAGSRNSCR